MLDLQFPPFGLQVFRHETPVAVVRLVFTAQETAAFDRLRVDALFDLTLPDQVQKGGS